MNIVLGVTGGIAAYKAVGLARLLVEAGHEVHVVPTANALRFVGRPTWEAISRHPATSEVHDDVPEVRHVALGRRADLVVVAPATANTIARIASGIADDLLGTTLLATRAPVLIAPAMHSEMWSNPATQDNVAILRSRGIAIIGPESGRLTGDDSGPGRMSEPEEIASRIEGMLAETRAVTIGSRPETEQPAASDTGDPETRDPGVPDPDALSPSIRDTGIGATESRAQDLAGLRVLVSAGGTREPIDPVRYIGNRSSGRQGVAIAEAAADRGAKVVLLAANIDDAVLAPVAETGAVRIVPVSTAAELQSAATAAATGADVLVMAAAVADYRVAEVSETKLRKEENAGEELTLSLVENPDILVGLVRERRNDQLVVGFAAETVDDEDELIDRGRRKLARKGVDLLAVNAVGWTAGFESAENSLVVLDADGAVTQTVSGSKTATADGLLDAILAERRARELAD